MLYTNFCYRKIQISTTKRGGDLTDIYGCHFEYAGKNSREYGLILANVETSRNVSIAGSIQSTTQFSRQERRNYHLGSVYDNAAMNFDAEVISETPLDIRTQRAVEKWLFYHSDYQRLYIDLEDDLYGESYELIDGKRKRLYLNCRLTEPQKLEYNSGIVGYKFKIECDSCMAWQDAVTKDFPIDGSSDTMFSVDVDTDVRDFIYPKVTITTGSSGGDIAIVNHSDDSSRITAFSGLTANTEIIMDGKVNYISGNNYEKFAYKNFIRLLDGENRISVTGDAASISFEWQNMRYL